MAKSPKKRRSGAQRKQYAKRYARSGGFPDSVASLILPTHKKLQQSLSDSKWDQWRSANTKKRRPGFNKTMIKRANKRSQHDYELSEKVRKKMAGRLRAHRKAAGTGPKRPHIGRQVKITIKKPPKNLSVLQRHDITNDVLRKYGKKFGSSRHYG